MADIRIDTRIGIEGFKRMERQAVWFVALINHPLQRRRLERHAASIAQANQGR